MTRPITCIMHLPVDILCDIFAATNSIQISIILARSGRLLLSIWETNKEFICHDVLPASLPSYYDVHRVTKLEQSIQRGLEQPVRIRILQHAREARLAADIFAENFVKYYGAVGRCRFFGSHKRIQPPFLAKSERLRFISVYHTTQLLVICSEERSGVQRQTLAEILKNMFVHTYFQVEKVGRWLYCVCKYENRLCRTYCYVDDRSEQLYSLVPQKTRDR